MVRTFVRHDQFGEGRVLSFENGRFKIKFFGVDGVGSEQLFARDALNQGFLKPLLLENGRHCIGPDGMCAVVRPNAGGHAGLRRYDVLYQSGLPSVCSEDELEPIPSNSIPSPSSNLAVRQLHHLVEFHNREAFGLACLQNLRQGGQLSALLSARIDLHPHQAFVAGTVLDGRENLMQDRNRLANEVHRVLEDANIKLSCVATDLLGGTGQAILRGIVKGHTDPGWLADYAKTKLRSKKQELELALRGHITDHHRWMLAHLLEELDFKDGLLDRLEEQIQKRVEPDAETIALLETIPGVGVRAAWTILSEIGNNVEVFGSAGQLASWAGLAPGNYQSAGQRRYVSTLKGNRHIRRLMVQCAWAATRVKNSYLGAFFKRVLARRGHLKALVAVAHKLALILFQILKKREAYQELGANFYDRKNIARVAARTVSRLEKLGYEVVLTPKPQLVQAIESTRVRGSHFRRNSILNSAAKCLL